MKAAVGDRITVHGLHVGDANRCCEVLEVKGVGGEPPYVVRWDDGHEALFVPVGCQNSAAVRDQRFQAAGSYWLMRPPRIGRRQLLP